MGLEKLLNAESVAIIGASRTETKRGYQAIRTLMEEKYEGRIYPVNPNEKKILGFKCYPSIGDIPDPVDAVLITTPAKTIPGILKDCAKKEVKGAVIIAGGFGESGAQGRKLEDEMVAIAQEHGIRLIGPNTSGMMNLKSGLNLVGLRDAPKGNIALLSQSGNMALTLITEAKLRSLKGFSYYVGIGNEADIKFHEYLEFFRQDPQTKVILMYVEGMRDGRHFLQQAHATTPDTPIVLLKSGRSDTGKRAAGSHTGALAGMSRVALSAFRRAGIVVIEKSDELFPVAETLASLPSMRNNNVAVLADGGGHATIAADLLSDLNVDIPELSTRTQNSLKKLLPAAATVRNPVDVAGGTDADPTVFADCAEILLKDPNVGGLLIVGLFGGYGIRFAESLSLKEEDAAHRMGKMVQKYKKPIVLHSLYNSEKPHSLHLLRYYGITVYDSLDIACKCIGSLAWYGQYVRQHHAKTNFELRVGAGRRQQGARLFQRAYKEGRLALLEHEAKELLGLHGAPVTRDVLAQTADEAVKLAEAADGKVVMKIVSPDILHKSDAGGVKLNLKTETEVRQAFDSIMASTAAYNPAADIRGVIVAPMSSPGIEVIIGTKIDDQFGPVIMFGIGGIMVEVLKDVAFRVLPITPYWAEKMLDDIKTAALLNGFRGAPPSDKKAIKKLLLTCSDLIEAYPEIEEMDLNPVIVYDKGISIVDARIILKPADAVRGLPDKPVGSVKKTRRTTEKS